MKKTKITLTDRVLCDIVLYIKEYYGRKGNMISSEILRGHLDTIILKLIIEKDRYGYEISKEISIRTNGDFQIKEATLYAVIQRLEKKKCIMSYYGDETNGGRRKYYSITAIGRSEYKELIESFKETLRIIQLFMEDEMI